MSNKYEESGVSLEKGYESVERIKKHVKRVAREGCRLQGYHWADQ